MQTGSSPYRTVRQLVSETGAPAWLIRRLVDRLDGGRCQRVGQGLRLIPPDLVADVKAALLQRARQSVAAKGGVP